MNRLALCFLSLAAAAPLGAQATAWPTAQITVDATSDLDFARIDLASPKLVSATDSAHWDLAVRRYEFRLNTGVSATLLVDNTVQAAADPNAASAASQLPTFDAVTAADIPSDARFGSALPNSVAVEDSPPFLYGRDPASPHGVAPTYNIYLIRRGDTVYKVQMLDYYHPVTGASRHITLRVARIR